MNRQLRAIGVALIAALMILVLAPTSASAHDPAGEQSESLKGTVYDGHVADPSPGGVPMQAISDADCVDGMAADLFPCENVDLMSFIPLTDVDASFANDVWGWTDHKTKMEVAIVGTFEGTVFVDVTDGANPVYLGLLESAAPDLFGNIWGDIRVYDNVAYIGSEAVNRDTGEGFGIQIVDLTQFRGATGPIDIEQAGRITDMTNSHNVSLNVDSGRLYVVGSTRFLQECQTGEGQANGDGGALVYDVAANPLDPQFIGCLDQDGYIHDITCEYYKGPDLDYRHEEICIGSNEDSVTVYHVDDIDDVSILSRIEYQDFPFLDAGSNLPNYYSHQGWMSDDHSFFFLGDELDEFSSGFTRTTYIWDLSDLDEITLIEAFSDGNTSIDHNMFVDKSRLYQSNYTSGLWIYDTWEARDGNLDMRGFFDVFPVNDDPTFNGTWGNYPYFAGGKVIVTSSEEGIFVLDAKAAQNRAGGKGKGNSGKFYI